MDANQFIDLLEGHGVDFFTGVPDSLLSPLCDALMRRYGAEGKRHVVGHNEGGCVGLAVGSYLAGNGKLPCVYMQNSGIGNALNPAVSLAHPKIYGIPILYIVGWRGQPGHKDEPQHVYQGEITKELLALQGMQVLVLDRDTEEDQLGAFLEAFLVGAAAGESRVILVQKGALQNTEKYAYTNRHTLAREDAVQLVAQLAGDDIIVSTTGKISRELFEYRETVGHGHGQDFLTVGSMGHSAMIALGIALRRPTRRVWCLDGDGSMLMHMGTLAVIASRAPENYVHVLLNNAAHETVGGVPTVAATVDFPALAKAVGYREGHSAHTAVEFTKLLRDAAVAKGPVLVEAKVALGARADLGRPTTTPVQNRDALIKTLEETE